MTTPELLVALREELADERSFFLAFQPCSEEAPQLARRMHLLAEVLVYMLDAERLRRAVKELRYWQTFIPDGILSAQEIGAEEGKALVAMYEALDGKPTKGAVSE